jgi:alpha-galactosidase
MSQTFHRLYQKRLARGYWRDRVRPILNNNWEATYFDFTQERLIEIAEKAKECGVELFVLDDGWFGQRCHERAGLGDWVANPERLAEGIEGLAEKIENLGMKFGLWFEPEMVNKDSELYRAHPDWIIETPGRHSCHGRFQYVLDFSRKEVVDAIYAMMEKILGGAKVSYVKWDMNRSITECYSKGLAADRQGEVFHRYILGVYDLYDRLVTKFPKVLFESCASGPGLTREFCIMRPRAGQAMIRMRWKG